MQTLRQRPAAREQSSKIRSQSVQRRPFVGVEVKEGYDSVVTLQYYEKSCFTYLFGRAGT